MPDKPNNYKTKPFSKGNHAANDNPGKRVVIKYLGAKGIDAVENPNRYGIDILAAWYEVERRTILTNKWPYPTVHIPYRKKKFFKNKCIYAVNVHHKFFDYSYDGLMFCGSDVVVEYPVIEVPNKSVEKDEYFYDVPLHEFTKEINVSACELSEFLNDINGVL